MSPESSEEQANRNEDTRSSKQEDAPELPFVLALPLTSAAPCTPEQILLGPPVDPHLRIRGYSDDEFELFVREWAYYHEQLQTKRYVQVGRFGGAGDMGRDVVGYIDPPSSAGRLDIYQCKHLDHPLYPSDVWIELAKLCYFTFAKRFAVPERYRFVGRLDVGADLGRLLEDPSALRHRLIEEWEERVATKLSHGKRIPLEGQLLEHVNQFDFARVGYKPLHEILADLKQTSRYAPRFGGGLLRPCPPDQKPPNDIQPHEQRYVDQLIAAYQDHNADAVTLANLPRYADFSSHFTRSRERYFCAETLRQFARDNLPAGTTFDQVQDQVFDAVIDVAESAHNSGFDRVKAVTNHASLYNVVNHPLRTYMKSRSLAGICHQLANVDRLQWVR